VARTTCLSGWSRVSGATGGRRNISPQDFCLRLSSGDLLRASRARTTSCPGHPKVASRSKLRGIQPKGLMGLDRGLLKKVDEERNESPFGIPSIILILSKIPRSVLRTSLREPAFPVRRSPTLRTAYRTSSPISRSAAPRRRRSPPPPARGRPALTGPPPASGETRASHPPSLSRCAIHN
jgi:hypothetical protein